MWQPLHLCSQHRRCCELKVLPSYTGAAQTVALACDDGTLRLFTAEHGTPRLMYHKSMPRLGGRLLSVAWHPNGQSVVTGTAVGTLHAWHIAKSQELMRISIGKVLATCVAWLSAHETVHHRHCLSRQHSYKLKPSYGDGHDGLAISSAT